MTSPSSRLAVALDVDDPDRALEIARAVAPCAGVLKVSPAHLYARGESFLAEVRRIGRKVFLDVKLYDIPETVARLTRQVVRMGVDYVTVHASGGSEMIRRAADAAKGSQLNIIAVTVLTSFSQEQLKKEWKLAEPVEDRVAFWAALARDAGAAGLVCAPPDLKAVRAMAGDGLLAVVPGIRGAGDARGDQRRTMTAGEAIRAGAGIVVVGRPIVAAADPGAAAEKILAEIEEAA